LQILDIEKRFGNTRFMCTEVRPSVSATRYSTTVIPPDPHRQVALLLCDSLLHVLIEERVIAKRKAIGAIVAVVELVCETVEDGETPDARRIRARLGRRGKGVALALVERIMESFLEKSSR
jgi:hypothetical protein